MVNYGQKRSFTVQKRSIMVKNGHLLSFTVNYGLKKTVNYSQKRSITVKKKGKLRSKMVNYCQNGQ